MNVIITIGTADGVQQLYATMPPEDVDYLQSRIGTFTPELVLTFRAAIRPDGPAYSRVIRAHLILSVEPQ